MSGGTPPGPIGCDGARPRIDAGTVARTPMGAPPSLGLDLCPTGTADPSADWHGPGGDPFGHWDGDAPPTPTSDWEVPSAGAIPYAIGQTSLVRIPIPGTNGLAIELRPRGRIPTDGSTSTLFFQDQSGRRHLRLDYGFNPRTGQIDYHWNQRGTHAQFGISDHTPAGPSGAAAHRWAKAFRAGGRVLLVVGVGMDLVSIVQADRPLRRTSEVIGGWAGAWAGCKILGAGGALLGTSATPIGTGLLGLGGCVLGGIGGYFGGSSVAGAIYDWAEDTQFTPLPEVSNPAPTGAGR